MTKRYRSWRLTLKQGDGSISHANMTTEPTTPADFGKEIQHHFLAHRLQAWEPREASVVADD